MVLGLTATACGNDKTPNALSPSNAPTPAVSATLPPEANSPETSNPASTIAPLPGALVPGTVPSSGVNPPGASGNIPSGSNDNPPPRRKKAQVKKVTEPAPKVTYYNTPEKGKPRSKPAKTVKETDGDGLVENSKKLPTRPRKPKDTSSDSSDEKEPAAKPAKPPKADADGGESPKVKSPKADADEAEAKKSKPAADSENKN